MYSLGTWFVSGICVWISYIKETMIVMMMMMMVTIIIILIRRRWCKAIDISDNDTEGKYC